MKKFTYIHTLYLPFFSKVFYADVALRWRGLGYWVLLFFVTLSWLPSSGNVQIEINDWMRNESSHFIEQIPVIMIKDGLAYVDEPMPYHIYDVSGDTAVITIDTRETPLQMGETEADLVLWRDQVGLRKSENEYRLYSLERVESFAFDRQRAESWLDIFQKVAGILFFISMVLFSFVYRVVQSLVYAGIGSFLAGELRKDFNFSTFIRLAVMSVIPVILLDTGLDILGLSMPYWALVYFTIAMAYLYFGIHAVQTELKTGSEE